MRNKRTCLASDVRLEQLCHFIGSCLPGEVGRHYFECLQEVCEEQTGVGIFLLLRPWGVHKGGSAHVRVAPAASLQSQQPWQVLIINQFKDIGGV